MFKYLDKSPFHCRIAVREGTNLQGQCKGGHLFTNWPPSAFFRCFLCCCVAFCVDSCLDVEHTCPNYKTPVPILFMNLSVLIKQTKPIRPRTRIIICCKNVIHITLKLASGPGFETWRDNASSYQTNT